MRTQMHRGTATWGHRRRHLHAKERPQGDPPWHTVTLVIQAHDGEGPVSVLWAQPCGTCGRLIQFLCARCCSRHEAYPVDFQTDSALASKMLLLLWMTQAQGAGEDLLRVSGIWSFILEDVTSGYHFLGDKKRCINQCVLTSVVGWPRCGDRAWS